MIKDQFSFIFNKEQKTEDPSCSTIEILQIDARTRPLFLLHYYRPYDFAIYSLKALCKILNISNAFKYFMNNSLFLHYYILRESFYNNMWCANILAIKIIY